ncbi:hypothetical protein FE782_01565 [Paenibacillus antri]|uniref:Ferric oxidoreductase domain-containing protein n=1 Tax=Paenibacillus antri TaxID=2582848 RepID=A0A5R9GLP4_9BACL|nr:hypothetical protein [Paenibacillus antri]TLS54063.1 hypothetical protein FE782_01565 [Paenibacillus antri]
MPLRNKTMIAPYGQLAAQLAVVLFFVNLSLAFLFFVIKRSAWKAVKVASVKLARKLMKSHIYVGIAGTALIVIHAGVMLAQLGRYVGYVHPKMVSGYAAILLLAITVAAGYLRSRRASGFRRKFHLTAALVFAGLFLAHIFVR